MDSNGRGGSAGVGRPNGLRITGRRGALNKKALKKGTISRAEGGRVHGLVSRHLRWLSSKFSSFTGYAVLFKELMKECDNQRSGVWNLQFISAETIYLISKKTKLPISRNHIRITFGICPVAVGIMLLSVNFNNDALMV